MSHVPHHALLRYRPFSICYHASFLPIFNTHDMHMHMHMHMHMYMCVEDVHVHVHVC